MNKIVLLIFVVLGLFTHATAQESKPVLDINLSNYSYPYEVNYIIFESQGHTLRMAYMDVHPSSYNGKTILLMHGKNFNGAYWKTTADALLQEGYRVIIPDQIGFGKSTKPTGYQYTFQQLALNTRNLIDQLQLSKIYLLGHSMGGMLATRFTLMYPEQVEKLILVNPIGLEDWKLVAPYTSIDENYAKELKATYESVKAYESASYYDNLWKPEYEEWVYLITGWIEDPEYPVVALNNAQTSDMIFTQPVVYEFEKIEVPTLLIIGTRDRTAIGKEKVKEKAVKEKMGQYQHLGKLTHTKIPGSILVELENVGHLPHIEDFERFIKPLQEFLK